jgi:hypothetical protein
MALGFSGSGTVVARARAIIEADTSGVSSGMSRADRDFDKATKNMEAHASRLRQALEFGGSAAAFQVAFAKIEQASGALFDRWKEEQTTAAQTAAVIKSTGGAAGVSAEQISKLAKSLQDKSGTDKTVIQSGANMLLTFTNIRNEAGKGNDVFNQSTKTLLDMATALHEDVPKAAIQLGKALNDPVKGMTALRRVGVTFTSDQQDQVKALVNSGHALDAQKLILRELNREFGNSAEAAGKTLPGQLNRMKFAVEDAAISYAQRLEPAVEKFVDRAEVEAKTILKSEGAHKALKVGVELLKDAFTGAQTIVTTFADLMHNKVARSLAIVYAGLGALAFAIDANPFMALATAAVIAVGLIVRHWSSISAWFSRLWTTIKESGEAAWNALKDTAKLAVHSILVYATSAIVGILEVASHLPIVGGKAKAALHSIEDYLDKWKPDWSNVTAVFAKGGEDAGSAFSSSLLGQTTGIPDALAGLVSGATTGGKVGGSKSATWEAGTAFAVVMKAKSLGVGSGGVYQAGGGHGGIVKPGAVLDCSGFVYQSFTQAGFKGFPGTSETQWSTDSGPNWTSERIAPSAAKPGDVVFMVGSPEYPSPGHVGLITGGSGMSSIVMQYYSTGKPADTIPLSSIHDLVGIKRFYFVTKDSSKTSTPTPSTPTSADPLSTDDFTNTNAANAAKAAAAAKKAAAAKAKAERAKTAQDLRNESLRELRATAKSVTDEASSLTGDAKKKVTPLVEEVRKILANPQPSPADLKRLRYDLGQIKTVVSDAAKDAKKAAADAVAKAKREAAAETLRDTEKSIEAEFPLLSDSLKAQAKPLMGEVGNLLAKGIVPTAAQLAKAKTDLSKLKAIVKTAVSEAKTALDSEKSAFEKSWSDLTDKIGTAFDAATQKGLANITASTSFGTIGANDKTPAEIALQQLQDQHDKDQAAADMAAALADQTTKATTLQQALASGDPTAIAQAKADYDDATKTVADLAYQAKVAELQAQADAQRDEADKAISDAQAQYQTQRDLQKTALDNQLSDLATKLETGKETYSQYMKDVAAILNDPDYGVSISDSGDTLGSMFADAFTTSFNSVTDAINQMIDALNKYNALVGKPAVGKVAAVTPTVSKKTATKINTAAAKAGQPISEHGLGMYASGGVFYDPTAIVIGDGPTPEVAVPISAEVAAQLGSRSGARLNPSTRALLSGAIEQAVRGGNGGGDTHVTKSVEVHLHTAASPEDPATWLRSAKFVADHVFGS